MKMKTILPLSEARRRIFSLAEDVQNLETHYTLTERGKPKAVIMSANRFESLMGGRLSNASYASSVREAPRVLYGAGESTQGKASKRDYFILREVPRTLYLNGQTGDHLYHAKELAKAQLYVELVEDKGYPYETIEVGRCVKVGGENSRKYIEADIIVEDRRRGVLLLFAVAAPKLYTSHKEAALRELFELAQTFYDGRQKSVFLGYYTRSYENGKAERKAIIIDYMRYGTFERWKECGEPKEEILPTYESLKSKV